MAQVVYEFPLNEKVRNYLRVEHLLGLLSEPKKTCEQHTEIQFFRDFFALLDLVERIDLRTELLLDLHRKGSGPARPSAPTGVVTMGVPHSMASMILPFRPAPKRSGARQTRADQK